MTHPLDADYTQAWVDMALSIKVGGPLPLTFSIRTPDKGKLKVVASIWTACVDDGIPTTVSVEETYPIFLAPNESIFWALAQQLYLHELAEWYEFQGKKFRDPHKPVDSDQAQVHDGSRLPDLLHPIAE